MPLDKLVQRRDQRDVPRRIDAGRRLRHSGGYMVGVGIKQPCPSTKCWMYFPEDNCPFYRVTYLSNYSPDVVPDATNQYSILAEISHSVHKPVSRATVVDDTIQGLVNTRMISEADRRSIVDAFLIERDYTYPTPSLERDEALCVVQPWLEKKECLLAGSLRRLAVRGGKHGPLGSAGRGVGEPHGARRSGERVDVAREAGLLTRTSRSGSSWM